ncbi:formyl transferase [Daejeonella sp. H1SJ63]|uniref:formyl transferase n=1 Tax=Daejeonella sp. H1SJ63 TaxID=3034145 RepID=UPI0023EBAC31|nr:formyl transferase [Daejeonella sp. H1SJ63]
MNETPKILLIIGNQRRHLYFASIIQKAYPLAGVILVERGIDMPSVPDGLEEIDRHNFEMHFANRRKAEEKHFREIDELKCKILPVDFDKLNTPECVDFVSGFNPDLAFVFGPGLIKDPLLGVLPSETINTHSGLSPRYRGSATLFWPFYFLEPNYAGATFHYLQDQPDAGDIIHQVLPKLAYGDKIHDVACKVIAESATAITELIKHYIERGSWTSYPQKHSGKNFLDSDFHPAQLRLIYNTFNDDIVDHFLNNKLRSKTPKTIDQFK